MSWPKGKPRPPKAVNLVGEKFNRLMVVSRSENRGDGRAYWNCICDCGGINIAAANDLKSGHTKSCGCLNDEIRQSKPVKHGHNKTRTYISWCSMWARCTNKKLKSYEYYGGRGIGVCDRWKDFGLFLQDMGERPEGRSIDRFPDNDGNYEPSNCRWATPKEQRANQRPRRAAAAIGEAMP